jgi:O-antigen/teichoic acid export membrane protein
MANRARFQGSLRTVAKFSLVMFAGLIFSKLFTYGIKFFVARDLGPEVYGLFSLASAILLFFVYFFGLGLPDGILRFSSFYNRPSDAHKIKYLTKFSLVLLSFSGILGCAILFSFSDIIANEIFHNHQLEYFLKWFSLIIPFYIGFNLFLSFLRGNQRIVPYSLLLNITHPGLNLLILFLLVYAGYKSSSIVFSYLLSTVAVFFMSFLVCKKAISNKKDDRKPNANVKHEILSKLFVYSWPLIFSTILMNLFNWTDTYAIGYLKTASDVGYYNVAVTLANLFSLAPAIIGATFFPIAVKEYSNKRINLVKKLSQQMTKWIFIFNLPIFIILILFPGAVINLLFGPQYLIAENALRILSVGTLLTSILIVSSDLISMVGKSKVLLYNTTLLTIFNIVLNLYLIPIYGINGAAFSTAASLAIWGLIATIEARSFLSFVPLKFSILKIFLLSVIPSALLFYSRSLFPKTLLSLFLQASVFFLIYLFLMIYSEVLDDNDYMVLNTIKSKLFGKK